MRDPISMPQHRGWYALAAFVVCLALFLRFYDLLSLPIFTDEATYLRWAADILDQKTFMSLFIPVAEDGKQPLFVWLSTAAMSVFSDPLLAGRMVSVAAGIASVLGVLLAGRWLEDDLVGLLAGFLYAVVPYLLLFDRMALADSLVSTSAIWAFGLGVFLARRAADYRSAILAGIVLGAIAAGGVWVKSTALFVLPFPVLSLLLLRTGGRPLRHALSGIAAAYAAFGFLASLLVAMPYAEIQLTLLATHVYSPEELNDSLPTGAWTANLTAYWPWVEAYLPAPLCWLVLAAFLRGLFWRRRQTLLLVGCWLAVMLPSIVLAQFFASRYVLHSVFPMLFLAALLAKDAGGWLAGGLEKGRYLSGRPLPATAASAALIVVATLPSLVFDFQLLTDPISAPWPASDRKEYVEGWSAGYGFNEALATALQKAREYDRDVFILSDHFQGLSHDGLALYVRRMPKIRHYVDGKIAWGGREIIDAWRSHGVPLIIVRNDGRFKPEQFEERIPEAKRIGVFWKPGGVNSFRVYEMTIQGSGSGG